MGKLLRIMQVVGRREIPWSKKHIGVMEASRKGREGGRVVKWMMQGWEAGGRGKLMIRIGEVEQIEKHTTAEAEAFGRRGCGHIARRTGMERRGAMFGIESGWKVRKLGLQPVQFKGSGKKKAGGNSCLGQKARGHCGVIMSY